MTNCFSYYWFLLSCVIGLIVGGALNTRAELELELPLEQMIRRCIYEVYKKKCRAFTFNRLFEFQL